MASLTSTKPAATYKSLLKIEGTNQEADGTLRVVEDGAGNDTSLKLTATGTTIGASIAGRVGLGTDSPDNILHVKAADPIVWIQDTETTASSASAHIRITESSGSNIDNWAGMGYASNQLQLSFGAAYDGSADVRMALDANSCVFLSTGEGTDNTVFGALAGNALASGAIDNTLIGDSAGLLIDSGDSNVCVGRFAGKALTSGTGNTLIGKEAGLVATSSGSTGIGFKALIALEDGSNNTAVGYQAGSGITTADDSVFVGKEAGENVTVADGCVAIGKNAFGGVTVEAVNYCVAIGHSAIQGTSATNQAGTVGIGFNALSSLTTGAGNTAVGYRACIAAISGGSNTVVGFEACSNASMNASFATALGHRALYALTTGGDNTAVGRSAGDTITDGTKNTCLGHGADTSASGSTNQAVIGDTATGVADNSVTLGNASVTAVYMGQDSGAVVHCGAVVHGLTGIVVTTGTLAYATHSASKLKYVIVDADAQTLTLPAVQIGAVFIIVNNVTDGGALLTIDPNANDKFLTDIAGGVGTDGNNISNTKATQNQGDFVKLVGMSADGWAITEIGGIWADE